MGIKGNNKESRTSNHTKWSSAPHKQRMPPLSKALLICFICLFIAFTIFNPKACLTIGRTLIASVILLMASLRMLAVLITLAQSHRSKYNAKDITDTSLSSVAWPHFTVLVPLYKEADVVQSLMNNLAKLDYPQEKLNIIMVCETDDRPTWEEVIKHIHPPFKLFKVEPSEPRTKPKALNEALQSVPAANANDIVTIYDAEDRPHPYQLKAAALALINHPELAAVQAPLGYYNAKQNLLTRLFALEYAALFHVWNPALTYLHLPFTLGGTSNHIRRSIIDNVGGWDSHNVTEDADLSFKITALSNRKHPHKIGCIQYGTQEEAVDDIKAWTHQRSRWLKGFMQTWTVHMRRKQYNPSGGTFHILPRILNAISLQITVGITLLAAFLHVPSLFILSSLITADQLDILSFTLAPAYYVLLGYGYGAAILSGVIGAIKEGKPHLIPYTLLMPVYWLLQFPAALIAAREFITAPSYWRKTTHIGEVITDDPADTFSPLEPSLGHPI